MFLFVQLAGSWQNINRTYKTAGLSDCLSNPLQMQLTYVKKELRNVAGWDGSLLCSSQGFDIERDAFWLG